ncbi:MAG TPA: AmmeMemoRadiSam system protein B [Anaerohalosphaeraceae bacterium]|jgi:AmmeMemoRadiSam system protein B|nr:AmmeMemoRadiSam system protein B [Anaerohalosphaeraceae bacterium]HRT48994.1 AmmeMemoRadiSam system protein B [Anaerohalosphaeraceae bacterium]HRT85117.1 AmmeMemoRadiSam system protein B [Anaerohalosphaeraceae bacterium]
MQVRKPAVAGQFYSDNRDKCLRELKECLSARTIDVALPDEIVAAIVPHAGWLFSGDVAGLAFSAIRQVHEQVDTFIIFGAAHRYLGRNAVLFQEGRWSTPLGEIEIDADLAREIAAIDCVTPDAEPHSGEHSIEVQTPFIQYLFPKAKIVPIIVPSAEFDLRLGARIGDIIEESGGKKIVAVASTDLTHYGPRYGFYPQGTGPEAIKWAKDVNDMDFIRLALSMEPHRLLEVAVQRENACGPGAAAAVVAVASRLGKTQGVLLAHTHSNEVMEERFGQSSEESVGYAAIIY